MKLTAPKCETLIWGGIFIILALYLWQIYSSGPRAYNQVDYFENNNNNNNTGSIATNNIGTNVNNRVNGSNAPAPVNNNNNNNVRRRNNNNNNNNNNGTNVVASEQMGFNEHPAKVSFDKRKGDLTVQDLLPATNAQSVEDFNNVNIGEGVMQGINFLTAGYNTGVNTVGQSLRNANLQLRAEPPNPQVTVSPWNNSSIGPDLLRRPVDIDTCGTAVNNL